MSMILSSAIAYHYRVSSII